MRFVLGFSDNERAQNFYRAVGVVIILVGVLTDYQNQSLTRD